MSCDGSGGGGFLMFSHNIYLLHVVMITNSNELQAKPLGLSAI